MAGGHGPIGACECGALDWTLVVRDGGSGAMFVGFGWWLVMGDGGVLGPCGRGARGVWLGERQRTPRRGNGECQS